MMEGKVGLFAILYAKDDKSGIILVRHAYGQQGWGLPGGGLESFELITDGVLREIKEETGYINVEIVRLVGIFSSRLGHSPIVLFECELQNLENVSFDRKEIAELSSFHLDELPEGLYPAQRRLIDFWRGTLKSHNYNGQIFDYLSDKKT